MTRILFFGDLAATGFGTVTTNLGREMIAAGHDLRFVSQNDLGELEEPFASRTFSVNEQRLGWMNAQDFRDNGMAAGLINGSVWEDRWTPEVVIVTGDFYAIRGLVYHDEPTEEAFRSVPVLHYAPIEGRHLPPAWSILWDFVRPVAMSEFGADEIAKVTGRRPPVIYHGVDTDSFFQASAKRPIRIGDKTIRTKAEARAHFEGVPSDARVLLRTDRNMLRKDYGALMLALAPVLQARPDTMLLMHAKCMDEGGELRDIQSHVMAIYGKHVALRMKFTNIQDKGLSFSRTELNILYNCADLYVSTSSEGFGLTIAEALACGVPAVGQAYSSVPEVIGPAGRTVPIRDEMRNPYAHTWGVINETAFAQTVGELLDDPVQRLLLGAKGPFHVATHFSWKHAAEQFGQLAEQATAERLVAA